MVGFSADGKWLAADSHNKRIVWSASNWEIQHEQNRTESLPGQVAFSSDGKWIAMTKNRFLVELVDRHTLQVLAAFPIEDRRNVLRMAFARDRSRLAIALRDRFEVWDIADLRHRLQELNLDW